MFMALADLGIRAALADNGAAFHPYILYGDWTEQERAIVSAVLDKHCPKAVDSGFNNWGFTKYTHEDGAYVDFVGKRATWDCVWGARTAEELAKKIEEYYAK